MKHLTPKRRKFLYRLSAAALVVAGVYGFVDGEQSDALLLLFAAGFGIADQHVNEAN